MNSEKRVAKRTRERERETCMSSVPNGSLWGQKAQQLLKTLEWLLSIDDIEVSAVLNQAAQSIAETLSAEKVEVFIHNRESHTLVALGTSDLSIVEGEQAHELHQLPLANRGRIVLTFLEGGSYITGRADLDAEEQRDTTSLEEPGIRSAIIVPIEVNGERQGSSSLPARSPIFSPSPIFTT